jgi:hypothetical protein
MSLKYSTDVPVGNAGLVPFTSVDSECTDCASTSLTNSLETMDAGLNIEATGAAVAKAGIPEAAKEGTEPFAEMLLPDAELGDGLELDLKEESKF